MSDSETQELLSTQSEERLSRLTSLKGRVAIVVGAGSVGAGMGIGRATAILLADAVGRTHDLIEQSSGRSSAAVADIANPDELDAAIKLLAERLGNPSILVNNVGIVGPPGTAETSIIGDWDRALRINVTAMAQSVQSVIPFMRQEGGGSIVNVASITGLAGGYPALFYPTSKGAVISLTKAMAAHHGRANIRVNAVAPGQLFTPRISGRGVTEELRKSRSDISALGTEGTGWDAAYAILYLNSDAARWVTGVVLPVDAGATAILPLASPQSA
jgi:NAD(P)-dependent dehydrogenase (short-subunit alcohol dehydrogenase family)